jgi:hypothetical protein
VAFLSHLPRLTIRPLQEAEMSWDEPTEDERQYIRYRWEFLRRNPEYKKDYVKLTQGDCKDLKEYRHKEKAFCDKWRILVTLNPAINYFEKGWEKKGDHNGHLGRSHRVHPDVTTTTFFDDMQHILFPRHLFRRPVEPINGESWEQYGPDEWAFNPREIRETGALEIRLDFRYSKRRLLDELELLIDQVKKECRQEEYSTSYHFKDFDMHLKVYDLKEAGEKDREIISILKLNSRQDVKNHYKAAKKYIEKGIHRYG